MDEQSFQTPQAAEIPPENRPKQLVLLPILLGMLFLTVVGVSAFFLGKNQANQSTVIVPTVIPSISLVPSSSVQDETVYTEGTRSANWKTYTDRDVGLEFKYPPIFSLNEDTSNATQFIVYFKQGTKDFRLDRFIASAQNEAPFNRTSITKILNGVTWKVVPPEKTSQYCDAGNCSKTAPTYYVYRNNYRYSFTYYSDDLQSTIEQILSTFKFLDQTTYTACGCGCCPGVTPVKQCIYHSKGDQLEKFIKEDTVIKNSSQCSMMECSRGIEYYYCD